MRKAAVLLLSATAVMMVVGVVITQSLLVLQRVAAVEEAQGVVWVRQRGHQEFAPLAGRPRVGAGDTIKTGDNSHLDLYWIDGTRMRVGPNALLKVLKSQHNAAFHSDTSMFKLDLGRVWIRILKVLSQKSKFEVITPTATAGVRGTIFAVAVGSDGRTTVSVKEGKVTVTEGSTESNVAKGTMDAGRGAEPLDPQERKAWQANEDIAGPHLELKMPPPGKLAASTGRDLLVWGETEPGAVVTVNGQAQTLKLERIFKTTVRTPDQAGPFQIVVEAKDRRGIVSSRTVSVNVRR